MKYRRRRWWKKCKERIVSLITVKRKEDEKENECRKNETNLGSLEGGSFSFCFWKGCSRKFR